MNDAVLQGLPGALFASAVLGGLQWVWRENVRPWLKRRRRRAVLGFDVDESEFAPTVIVESTTPTSTDHYRRPTVGYGAVLAMAHVSQLIAAVRRKAHRSGRIEVWMATDQIAARALSEDSQHAIVIGGPLSNTQTKRYLDWLNSELRDGDIALVPSDVFTPEERSERCEVGPEPIRYLEDDPSRGRALAIDCFAYRAAMTAEDGAPAAKADYSELSGTDYGLIIRGPARNRSGRLVIISGVHTFGLSGASRYLVDLLSLRLVPFGRNGVSSRRDLAEVLRYLGGPENEDVLLVVRTDFERGVITATRLVAAWRIVIGDQ